jgi:probable F420-dependent oxidoreductase
MNRKVLFDVVVPTDGPKVSIESILKFGLESERLGFDCLWVSDHLIDPTPFLYIVFPNLPEVGIKSYRIFEAWTTITALAVLTKRIRLGTYVLCNAFRQPSVLAKMSATLDVISNGRLNLGVGSGWLKSEFDAYGINMEKHQVRSEKLIEAIQVIKSLWTTPGTSFSGKYYFLSTANLDPKPIQKPYPPLFVGGWSQTCAEIVAEHADGWVPNNVDADILKKRISLLLKAAEDFGRDPHEIKIAYGIDYFIISKDSAEIEKVALAKLGSKKPGEPWFVGTPKQCSEKFAKYIDLGINEFIIKFAEPSTEALKLFAEEVMPRFE